MRQALSSAKGRGSLQSPARARPQVVYVDDNPETELLPTTVIVVSLPREGDGVTQVSRR